jgi:uncharacterized protein YegP (UPF0339 family)
MAEFEIYQDKTGDWRWRLCAGNGEILADSGEGYEDRDDCEKAIALVREIAPAAPLREVKG